MEKGVKLVFLIFFFFRGEGGFSFKEHPFFWVGFMIRLFLYLSDLKREVKLNRNVKKHFTFCAGLP